MRFFRYLFYFSGNFCLPLHELAFAQLFEQTCISSTLRDHLILLLYFPRKVCAKLRDLSGLGCGISSIIFERGDLGCGCGCVIQQAIPRVEQRLIEFGALPIECSQLGMQLVERGFRESRLTIAPC